MSLLFEPSPYTPDNDVNPICGCHLRARCAGCGVCTTCDGCYCDEDGSEYDYLYSLAVANSWMEDD
jgi:hypothetical protein